MKEYLAGNALAQHRLRNFLIPSALTLFLYVLVSLFMLALLNIKALWYVFSGQTAAPFTAQEVAPLTDRFIEFQDKLAMPTVMLFWVFVGAITYTIIWLLENVVFIAKTEVEESTYLRAGQTPQRQYWRSVIASNGLLALVVLVWISGIALYMRLFLPLFSQLLQSGLLSGPILQRLIDITGAVLANALTLYVLLLLARILTLSWRLNRPAA